MCGIAGYYGSPESKLPTRQLLGRMVDAIAHRGPDESGMHIEAGVGLGHARLAIIDIASGQQPMASAAGDLIVSFNGEIFNHVELRDDLIGRGHVFRTESDTEVILHAYQAMGPDCVRLFNGDFAFALFDRRLNRLMLARDRMGVRPLFYTWRNGCLYFASEAKALFAVPGVAAEIDPVALDQVFTFWFPLAPRTPFNGRITAHRKFAFRSTELDRVKDIKNALGATVNDVVMAACAGGLRTYLDGHGELPDEPLVAMVPVSIRTGEEEHRWTNRVSGLLAVLPTDEPDPLERVRRVHESMDSAKGMFQALPAETLTEFSEFPPPAVFARAMRMATRLSTRTAPPANLVISNVPGPRTPLYVAGSRLTHYYPVSTIVDGQGLNITVQSYLDTLDFGLVSCRELVPDLWDLVDLLVEEVDVLAKAAGLS